MGKGWGALALVFREAGGVLGAELKNHGVGFCGNGGDGKL